MIIGSEKKETMTKKILTDCDGVLLDWVTPFHEWMKRASYTLVDDTVYSIGDAYGIPREEGHELVEAFNNSEYIRNLKPLPGAVEYVAKLVEQGYEFHVITSLSDCPEAKGRRLMNLTEVFPGAIASLECLSCGADKDEALSPYKGTGLFWIEDKPENAYAGAAVGLKPILIDHGYNTDAVGIPTYKAWSGVYQHIINNPM
jgi:5'(3')-deoxyribonucleotidase